MSRVSLVNGGAVLVAIALSMWMAVERPSATGALHEASDGASTISLEDATGTLVPVRDYHRIVSASTVADRLVVELCDATALRAVTAQSTLGPDAHRFTGRDIIESVDHTEEVVALDPDLVLVQNVESPRRVARLREAGLTVFDLGRLEGVSSLRGDIVEVATLCGARERGERYRDAWLARLSRVASERPGPARRALYLTVYGDRLFGGTRGTSYHDVLTAAGLEDAAEERYRGWPQYAAEQILEMDPELIVTRTGMSASLCRGPLANLRACREGGMLEIDPMVLDDPGPGMLDAAEAVYAAAYPSPTE